MGLLPLHAPGSGTAGGVVETGGLGDWETPPGTAPGVLVMGWGVTGRAAGGVGVIAGGGAEAPTTGGPGWAAPGTVEVTVVR